MCLEDDLGGRLRFPYGELVGKQVAREEVRADHRRPTRWIDEVPIKIVRDSLVALPAHRNPFTTHPLVPVASGLSLPAPIRSESSDCQIFWAARAVLYTTKCRIMQRYSLHWVH